MPRNEPSRIVYLKGEAIYLRPLELADAPLCQRWINDPQTRVSLEAFMPFNEIAERKFIEGVSEATDRIVLMIVLKRGDRAIGSCGLRNIRWKDRCAEFGIMIGEHDCRGKGYGAEATRMIIKYAFETLNLHRLQLGVLDFNEAGIRAYEKAGFVKEGEQREFLFVNGRYANHLLYAILAKDYFAVRDGQRRR